MRLFSFEILKLNLIVWISTWAAVSADENMPPRPPNIIYILADDLGYGELGCYGQEKIQTPNIDDLARRGMRFTQHYSGSPVCASSRCVLMTGKHTGHAYVRNNTEKGGWGPDEPEGQTPLADAEITIAELLKEKGYQAAAIGKWGLGGPGSEGHPNFQGFDLFYGYLCQRVAHNYYPTHLWHNHDVDILGNDYFRAHQRLQEPPESDEGWKKYSGEVYSTDRMIEQALMFINKNKKKPFFLYYATIVPHAAIQVPDESLEQYKGKFEDQPYLGDKGYTPHPYPRAGYAAMITRMDRNVGRIVKTVRDLGLEDDTLIMFSSDNGPTFNGGVDAQYFNSAGTLRGLKGSLFEGGIRVPMIATWPTRIKPSTKTDLVSGFQDVLPTVCEVAQCEPPHGIDGLSFVPTLFSKDGDQDKHEFLYWELKNQQALRCGDWKLYRRTNKQGKITNRLFNLADDIAEENDLSKSNRTQLEKLLEIARRGRTKSSLFPSPYDRELQDAQ